jgi:hypothetical protein
MKFRVSVKRLLDGQYYARCETAPNGLLERVAKTEDDAVGRVQKEIEFQLEWCPCTGAAREQIEIEVVRRPCPVYPR